MPRRDSILKECHLLSLSASAADLLLPGFLFLSSNFFLSIMFIGFGINYSFLKIKTVPRCPITIVVVIVSDSKTSV